MDKIIYIYIYIIRKLSLIGIVLFQPRIHFYISILILSTDPVFYIIDNCTRSNLLNYVLSVIFTFSPRELEIAAIYKCNIMIVYGQT